MGEQKPKKAEFEAVSVPTLAQVLKPVKELKESFPPVSEKVADPPTMIASKDSTDKEAVFAKVESEKRNALIKAWEENEKAKVENKVHKKLTAVGSWETIKRAYVEMKIKKYEEKVDRKKAEYAELMKNKMAEIHLEAEEKKATIQAIQGEECLRIQETAAKYRSVGHLPGRYLGCFGS